VSGDTPEEMPSAGTLSEMMAALWSRHRALIISRLETVERAVDAAARASLDADTRAAAHREAHRLAGSLGTFGLPDGTLRARELEAAFDSDQVIDVKSAETAVRALRAQVESHR
jgi:HPt (histidine-containing phosphotransfer) domain-containing protein